MDSLGLCQGNQSFNSGNDCWNGIVIFFSAGNSHSIWNDGRLASVVICQQVPNIECQQPCLFEKGRQIGGELFVEQLKAAVSSTRGVPYRFIRELVVRPSIDLADVARPHLESRAKKETTEALPTRLLHRLAGSQLFSQAELGSYLLFDAPYARDLIELGMNDAHARREQLLEFFAPD